MLKHLNFKIGLLCVFASISTVSHAATGGDILPERTIFVTEATHNGDFLHDKTLVGRTVIESYSSSSTLTQ